METGSECESIHDIGSEVGTINVQLLIVLGVILVIMTCCCCGTSVPQPQKIVITPTFGAIATAKTGTIQPSKTPADTLEPVEKPTITKTSLPSKTRTPTNTQDLYIASLTATYKPSATQTLEPTKTKTKIPTPTIYPLEVVTILNKMKNLSDTEINKYCTQIYGARVQWTLKVENINRGSQWKYPNSYTLVLPGYEDEFLGIWLKNLSNDQLSRFNIGDTVTFIAYINSCTWMEISVVNPIFK